MSNGDGQQLTPQAKETIRQYILSLFLIPTVISTIIGVIFGYLIRDIAIAKAENQAITDAQKTLNEIYFRSVSYFQDMLIKSNELDALLKENKKLALMINKEYSNLQENSALNNRNIQIANILNKPNQIVSGITKVLRNDQSFLKEVAQQANKQEIGIYSRHKTWIMRLGRHGSTRIKVKRGDVVAVSLYGSAENSEFYYKIVESTGNSQSLNETTQVIMNKDLRWSPFFTKGLFVATENSTLDFQAEFIQEDISGMVRVFGLTILPEVIANRPDLLDY